MSGMVERSGRFRVYRVVESVPHLNLQAVEEPRLYTVYQSGYGDLQATVSDLRTGDLVAATPSGDPEAPDEAWRLTAVERVGGVAMDFAVGVDPPAVATDLFEPGQVESACTTLTDGGDAVGACCVQPRDPLPDGRFVPNVLAGLLPMESQFASVPGVGAPAAEALVLDPDPPDTDAFSRPYGVVLFFTAAGRALADEYRDRYDCPRDADTRPDYDPYGI
jgi:hypothetical protein